MTGPVRIPADVDREDAILAGLTARQVAALAVTAIVLYAGWGLVGAVVPVAVYLGGAVPVGLTVAGLVTVRRDGLSLDRLLLAAVRQRLAPQRQCAVPAAAAQVPGWLAPLVADGAPAAGPLMLPARGVDEAGVIDLGREGLAVIAAASTATFSLRTPAEQDALVAGFGSYLHSLSAPVQILIRAQRLDLTGQISELRERAPRLAHPALGTAARDHADYLAHLAAQRQLLRRQVLLVFRDPTPTHTRAEGGAGRRRRRPDPARGSDPATQPAAQAAGSRLLGRVSDAVALLRPAGVTLTVLDAHQTRGVLAAACRPDSLLAPSVSLADPDAVITTRTPADQDWELTSCRF